MFSKVLLHTPLHVTGTTPRSLPPGVACCFLCQVGEMGQTPLTLMAYDGGAKREVGSPSVGMLWPMGTSDSRSSNRRFQTLSIS